MTPVDDGLYGGLDDTSADQKHTKVAIESTTVSVRFRVSLDRFTIIPLSLFQSYYHIPS